MLSIYYPQLVWTENQLCISGSNHSNSYMINKMTAKNNRFHQRKNDFYWPGSFCDGFVLVFDARLWPSLDLLML